MTNSAGFLPKSGTISDRLQGYESHFNIMHNAAVLLATVSWSASDSRGISLSAKRKSVTHWASPNICRLNWLYF